MEPFIIFGIALSMLLGFFCGLIARGALAKFNLARRKGLQSTVPTVKHVKPERLSPEALEYWRGELRTIDPAPTGPILIGP